MNSQKFLNNFDTQFIAAVKSAASTGTPATELDYGIVRVSASAGAILGALADGDYYVLTAFKRLGSIESAVEIMKVTAVDTSVINETRLTVARGQEGTTPQAYVSGDYLSLRSTKGAFENVLQRSSNLSDLENSATARNALGLGRVDNTSDAEKPVSAATANALAAKAPSASPTLTGVTLVSGALHGVSVSISDGVINMASANHFRKTITANTTFSVTNVPATGTFAKFILELTNAGAYTITWWATINWGGSAPTFTVSGRDVLEIYTFDGGATWTGLVRKGF